MASMKWMLFFYVLLNSRATTLIPPDSFPTDICITCERISEKFVESYQKTARSNFGGGNTEWEEKKLKGYAKSETRFIEIIEGCCTKSDGQCTGFLEKYEDTIEDWYQTQPATSINEFHKWLCIDTAKVCCPAGTFGKNCRRCHYGDNGLICSGRGKCDGDGKRSGNGRCQCESNYAGTNCSKCQQGYVASVDDKNQLVCTDIDECHSSIILSPCLLYECRNTDGGYECFGEPFYRDYAKISTLTILFLTVGFLTYKDQHGIATIFCAAFCVLIVLFAKHII